MRQSLSEAELKSREISKMLDTFLSTADKKEGERWWWSILLQLKVRGNERGKGELPVNIVREKNSPLADVGRRWTRVLKAKSRMARHGSPRIANRRSSLCANLCALMAGDMTPALCRQLNHQRYERRHLFANRCLFPTR